MTNKVKRLYFYTTATLLSALAVALVLIALDENIIYFYSPSEIDDSKSADLLRVGGLVKDGSVRTAVSYTHLTLPTKRIV